MSSLATAVGAICGAADKRCRMDLHNGRLVSERDYMSSLSTRIVDEAARVGISASLHSQTLQAAVEQKYGADTAIVFRNGPTAKVLILEAKWPRAFLKPAYKWDSTNGRKGGSRSSHFSSQLSKQAALLPYAVVLEMFLIETAPGTLSPILDRDGATCIPRCEAAWYDAVRSTAPFPWKTPDFWQLAGSHYLRPTNLEFYVLEVAECRAGIPLEIINGSINLPTGDGTSAIVPVNFESAAPTDGHRNAFRNIVVLDVTPRS